MVLIAVATLVAWAVSSAWLYRAAHHESERLFDAALIETGLALAAVYSHEGIREDDEIELEAIDHPHPEHIFYQIRSASGKIVYRSPGAPHKPLASTREEGFDEVRIEGTEYRVYTVRAPARGITLHVAQPESERQRLARSAALRLLAPGIVLALLLSLGVWGIVRRVTKPVVRFSAALDGRRPGDARPVDANGLPDEVAPVADAVNRLLERVESALLHERTLTADAAHELRTPLAALRAQAQVALRSRADVERDTALREMLAGVDRATRLVDRILTLARLDAARIDRSGLPTVDVARVAALVADELRGTAEARGVELSINAPETAIAADSESLAILLRNLIDNAVRHARARVVVDIDSDRGRCRIAVRDDGPGLPPEQATRAFDRFHRGSDGGAAGLGLAMVKRIAELHGGAASIGPGLGGRGLGVEVLLQEQGPDDGDRTGSEVAGRGSDVGRGSSVPDSIHDRRS